MESSPEKSRHLVNPIAVRNCTIVCGEREAAVLDISFMRVIVEETTPWTEIEQDQEVTLQFKLERVLFSAPVRLRARGDGWMRFSFEKFVPSAKAYLRSFLSPKKIGESLLEDWRTEAIRHFHGLNESELWFDNDGAVLFTYLDQADPTSQFIIRISELKAALKAGKIKRQDYMELKSLEGDLPLAPLTDREIVAKLGECRDIVTNFRPTGQTEYNLKQRLLKVISDHLYSTSHKVEMTPIRPVRSVSTSPPNEI